MRGKVTETISNIYNIRPNSGAAGCVLHSGKDVWVTQSISSINPAHKKPAVGLQ